MGTSDRWLKLSNWLTSLLNVLAYNFPRHSFALFGLYVESDCPVFSGTAWFPSLSDTVCFSAAVLSVWLAVLLQLVVILQLVVLLQLAVLL